MAKYFVRRRQVLATAGLGAVSGCLGLNLNSDELPDRPTAREPTGEKPSDTTPVVQFQYDAANIGVVESALPSGNGTDWRTTLPTSPEALVVADGRVVVTNNRTVVALDADSGDRQWEAPTRAIVAGVPAASPDTVYVSTQHPIQEGIRGIEALALDDGSLRWRAITDVSVAASPTLADGTLYVGGVTDRTHVLAVDATTGDELWRTPLDEAARENSHRKFADAPVPAVASGTVYAGGGDEDAVVALDATDGEELWRYDLDGTVVGHPSVHDGTIYAGSADGALYALTAGGEKRWSVDVDAPVTDSVAVTDDAIYVPAEEAFAVVSHGGDHLWSRTASETVLAPTVTNDGLVYADQAVVVARDFDGDERWRYEPDDRQGSDVGFTGIPIWPVARDGTVYATSDAGRVVALRASG